jgi:Rhodopirellula transposase DDE domain
MQDADAIERMKLQMPIRACHFPPGTDKWNKIEHRMFCQITQNRCGRHLVSHEVIVNLIASAATQHRLKIQTGIRRS